MRLQDDHSVCGFDFMHGIKKEDNGMNTRNLLAINMSILLFPVTIFAGGMSGENQALFHEYDTNNDNVISIDEAGKNVLLFRQFNNIDKNHNKKLERSEFSAFEPEENFQPPDMGEHEPGAGPLD